MKEVFDERRRGGRPVNSLGGDDLPAGSPLSLWLAVVLLCGLIFIAGLVLGSLKLPPVPQLHSAFQKVRELVNGPPTARAELMRMIFSDPIVADRIYPPIESLAGVKAANERMFINVNDFDTAYDRLRILGAAKLHLDNSSILRVDFELSGRRHEAYAYLIDREWRPSRHKRVASLIIPDTGTNVATRMLQRSPSDLRQTGLPSFTRPDNDQFLFIKPNEDALAFHNGKAKLSDIAVKNYQLNRGGSYAATYIVQSLAMTKYLRSLYPRIIVGGVSQGGAATLLNAIQSRPDVAVIASGYTALANGIEVSDLTQIAIPGVWRDNTPATLAAKLRILPTRFLFTWGEEDTPLYRLDVEHGYTCQVLDAASNVTCTSHPGGHHFPVDQVQAFLNAKLAPRR